MSQNGFAGKGGEGFPRTRHSYTIARAMRTPAAEGGGRAARMARKEEEEEDVGGEEEVRRGRRMGMSMSLIV